jgi:hypothetical protein
MMARSVHYKFFRLADLSSHKITVGMASRTFGDDGVGLPICPLTKLPLA